MNTAGEVEARDVSARVELNKDQRNSPRFKQDEYCIF